MPEHPTAEELQALCEGTIADEKRKKQVSLHLVAGCEVCRAALPEPSRRLVARELEGLFPSPEDEDAALEEAMDRAFQVALRHDRHLHRQRGVQAKKVLKLLEAEGLGAVEKARRSLGDLAVFEALSAKSWSLRHEDPAATLLFAREALKASRRLDPVRYGPEPVADWQARAWAELGNACRVADQLNEAKACFEEAVRVADLGTRDPVLHIRLLDFQASLAADRGEFRAACWFLTLVHQFHLGRGDRHLAGRALISKGIYTGNAGYWEDGIRLLQEGLVLIDQEQEPVLVLAAFHNQLWFLVESGRFDEAKRFYLQNSSLFARAGGKVNSLRLEWLRARTYAGLADLETAERRFREVKAGFKEVDRSYDAALAGLDLTALLLSRGRTREARELLREATRTFQDLEIERFNGVVLLLRRAAVLQDVATMHQIVIEAASFLRRAGYDPNARFEPDGWPPGPL